MRYSFTEIFTIPNTSVVLNVLIDSLVEDISDFNHVWDLNVDTYKDRIRSDIYEDQQHTTTIEDHQEFSEHVHSLCYLVRWKPVTNETEQREDVTSFDLLNDCRWTQNNDI